jgi:hypothetical protein
MPIPDAEKAVEQPLPVDDGIELKVCNFKYIGILFHRPFPSLRSPELATSSLLAVRKPVS